MTIAIIGQTLVLLALVAAVVGSIASFVGGHRIRIAAPDALMERSAPRIATGDRAADLGLVLARVVAVCSVLASFVLLYGLVGANFALSYVAARTSTDLPFVYRFTSLWSGQEGSLLLWLTVLSVFGVMMARSLKRAALPAAILANANGIVLLISTFFALLVAVVARPFAVVSELRADGAGMSPSLQNYWMAAHPPTLYLGYVGVAIPFAIVFGALLARRSDDHWIGATRRWVLFSWSMLTLGLILGARWAYEEIGWGGYWAWDPVENAALMPWLTATALLHSIMVQKRRGMMRFWNAILVSLTFGLSIFGTFITRSGVLSSVHSFVSSPVGWWFIGAIALIMVATLVLLFRSRNLLRAEHDVDSILSRETLLLFNNLLLVALALVVLWGVLYPILSAGFGGSRISLEKPWYDFFAMAFGLPLTLLLVSAPFVGWRSADPRIVGRHLVAPLIAGVAVGSLAWLWLGAAGPAAYAAVSLGVMVIGGIFVDVRRTLRSRKEGRPEETRWVRFREVGLRHQARWGAWVAHAGIALVVIAVAGSAWTMTSKATLEIGDSMQVGDYTLTLRDVDRKRTSATMQTRAVIEVERGGAASGTMRAGRDFHPTSGELSNEVAIRHVWLRGHDLFVNVDQLSEQRSVKLAAYVNPLVPLLWLGGLVTALGALIAGVPIRRGVDDASSDTNALSRVQASNDAVHELRNGAPTPG